VARAAGKMRARLGVACGEGMCARLGMARAGEEAFSPVPPCVARASEEVRGVEACSPIWIWR